MNRFLLLFALWIAWTDSLSAAVIEHDWKNPGDGLLTYDTINKREWLDLSQTLLSDQFPGSGANNTEIREARYQYVVGQTAPSGLFAGFAVAKSADVIALAESAGIDTSTSNFFVNSSSANSLVDLLSVTRDFGNGSQFSFGMLDEFDSSSSFPLRLSGLIYVDVVSGPDGLAGVRFSTGYTQFPDSPPGVMFYRVIAEPSASMLVLIAIGSFNLCGRHFSRPIA